MPMDVNAENESAATADHPAAAPANSVSDGVADPGPSANNTRAQLLVNVVVFQLKLFLDSLRDVILSPLSIAALILGILFGGRRPLQYFNALLRFGRRTEAWINLFGRYGSADTATDQSTRGSKSR